MDKYNNGRPIGVPENEGEKALAISEWAEGNEHLQNLLHLALIMVFKHMLHVKDMD